MADSIAEAEKEVAMSKKGKVMDLTA